VDGGVAPLDDDLGRPAFGAELVEHVARFLHRVALVFAQPLGVAQAVGQGALARERVAAVG
jgi:hypothetical protein